MEEKSRNSEKGGNSKAGEVKSKVLGYIKAGNTYAQTKELLEKEGVKYPALSKSFYQWKQQIFPEQKVEEALTKSGEKRRKKGEKKEAAVKRELWTSGKQKKADESKLAGLINQGLFTFIPCPHKGLTEKDVDEINVGGSVVATMQYFFPSLNLDHPVITLTVRVVLLVIKVKKMCYMVQQKINTVKDKLGIVDMEGLSGVKPEWKEAKQ